MIANHCYGLFELAAVHLSQNPPQLVQAQMAIDALGYVVAGLGDRLGEAQASLQEALTQVRLAFVQMGSAAGPGTVSPPRATRASTDRHRLNGSDPRTDRPPTVSPPTTAPRPVALPPAEVPIRR